MPISVANLIGQTFNSLYDQRPVWAIASNNTSANSPMVAMYGEASPYTPLNVESPGSIKSRSRNFQDEMANSANTFYGSTGQPSSQAWTPNGGFFGITVNTQTGCLNNFDAYDSGNYGWYGTSASQADLLACTSGTVVGEQNWRQCYDLILNTAGGLFKEEIGGSYAGATTGNRPFVNLNTDLTGQFTSVVGSPWGFGQIAHNRNTGRLMIAQPNGGASGTQITFRLHFFDLQLKISRATTLAQIKAAMQACVANGSNRYRYTDVAFANTRCYFASNSTYDMVDSEFVLCDNDEVWMFKSAETVSTGAQSGNALFRVNLTGGTWLTGTYAATFVVGWTGQTQYGLSGGYQYGARHTNSDDNSVVALYQHSYYYNNGYRIAFVSTKNAGATSFNMATLDGTTGDCYTIAPSGGPNFVMCHSGYNNDGFGPRIGFVDNQVLNAAAVTPSLGGSMFPSIGTSTMYGMNMVLKVQPTTEWK